MKPWGSGGGHVVIRPERLRWRGRVEIVAIQPALPRTSPLWLSAKAC